MPLEVLALASFLVVKLWLSREKIRGDQRSTYSQSESRGVIYGSADLSDDDDDDDRNKDIQDEEDMQTNCRHRASFTGPTTVQASQSRWLSSVIYLIICLTFLRASAVCTYPQSPIDSLRYLTYLHPPERTPDIAHACTPRSPRGLHDSLSTTPLHTRRSSPPDCALCVHSTTLVWRSDSRQWRVRGARRAFRGVVLPRPKG